MVEHLIHNKSLYFGRNHIKKARGRIKLNSESYTLKLEVGPHGGKLIPTILQFHEELLILLSKYYYLSLTGNHVGFGRGSNKTRNLVVYRKYCSDKNFLLFKRKEV